MPCKIQIKKQSTYLQYTKADNIHYHSKRGMGAEWRNIGPTCAYIRLNAKRANSKSCRSLSDVRGLRWLHPSNFAHCTLTHFLPSWAGAAPYLLLPLAGYPIAQASPALRGLQCNPAFTLWASHNGIPGPPWRDSLPFHVPGLRGSPSPWRKVPWPPTHVSFMALKSEPCGRILLPACNGAWPPESHWHKLFFIVAF